MPRWSRRMRSFVLPLFLTLFYSHRVSSFTFHSLARHWARSHSKQSNECRTLMISPSQQQLSQPMFASKKLISKPPNDVSHLLPIGEATISSESDVARQRIGTAPNKMVSPQTRQKISAALKARNMALKQNQTSLEIVGTSDDMGGQTEKESSVPPGIIQSSSTIASLSGNITSAQEEVKQKTHRLLQKKPAVAHSRRKPVRSQKSSLIRKQTLPPPPVNSSVGNGSSNAQHPKRKVNVISPETRAKMSATFRANYLVREQNRAKELGMTFEEYEQHKKEQLTQRKRAYERKRSRTRPNRNGKETTKRNLSSFVSSPHTALNVTIEQSNLNATMEEPVLNATHQESGLKGRSQSEETKAKIGASVKARALAKKQQLASEMGMTLEEYEEKKREENKVRQQLRQQLQNAGSPPASERMKRKWQDPEFREWQERILEQARTKLTLNSTREKLSQRTKQAWANGCYKNTTNSIRLYTDESRARLSQLSKNRWRQPGYKERMREVRKSEEWRAKVSSSIAKCWQRSEFREKVKAARELNSSSISVGERNTTTRITRSRNTTSRALPREKPVNKEKKIRIPRNVTESTDPPASKRPRGRPKTPKSLQTQRKQSKRDLRLALEKQPLYDFSEDEDEVEEIDRFQVNLRRREVPSQQQSIQAIKVYKDGKLLGIYTMEEFEAMKQREDLGNSITVS